MLEGVGTMLVGISVQLLAVTFALLAQGSANPAIGLLSMAGLGLVIAGALVGFTARTARLGPEAAGASEEDGS